MKKKLTPKQKQVAQWLVLRDLGLDPELNDLTLEELAKKAGVCRRTLYEWRKKPEFIDYMDSVADQFLKARVSTAYKQLMKLIEGKQPSVKALQLFFQIQGKLRDRQEITFTQKKETPKINADEELENLRKLLEE